MRCEYCDVEVVNYPDNGICVCCVPTATTNGSNANPIIF